MSRFFISLSAIVATVAGTMGLTPARAADSIWLHNGSEILLQARGNSRVLSYWKPRRGISARRGTVLFRGRRKGRLYIGTAYTFRRGCSPAPYRVQGVLPSEHRIVVTGAAPVRASGGCAVVRYSRNRKSARLVFTYLRRFSGAEPRPQPDPEPDPNLVPQPDPDPPVQPPVNPVFSKTITRTFTGGKVIFRVIDEGEPVSVPVKIEADVHCDSGAISEILRAHRVCELDDITYADDGLSLILHERHYTGQVCDRIVKTPVPIAGMCR